MPEIEILLAGYTFNTDQANLGLSTVTLVRGEVLTIIDVGHHGRRSQLLEQLRQRGVDPSDVARVVLTHAHWDHCQNTDLFPNAEIILHEKELEYTRNPRDGDFATARYFADTLRGHNVRLVSGEIELEPGVTLIETFGHTRGHISVLVDTPSGAVCIGGDAITEAGTIGRGAPGLIFWSENEARASVRKILDATRIIYPGHDRPFQVHGTGEIEYLSETPSLKFTGILDHAGSTFSVDVALAPHRGLLILPEARSDG